MLSRQGYDIVLYISFTDIFMKNKTNKHVFMIRARARDLLPVSATVRDVSIALYLSSPSSNNVHIHVS